MNDELRNMAERGIKLYCDSPDHIRHREQCRILGTICHAYLKLAAEHDAKPADDEEPVTADFIRSTGRVIRYDEECIVAQIAETDEISVQAIWECDWQKKNWRGVIRIYRRTIAGAVLVETKTKGHVRRLCAALGIPLKEQP